MKNKQIRVLLIEDNPGDIRLIQELLSEADTASFRIEVAERLSDGLEMLSDRIFDVVLLDLSLPDSSGLETLAEAHSRALQAAIIVLTGLDDEDLAVDAVRKGAQDYLVKGQIDENLLARAIRYAIERKRVEKEKKSLEAQLQYAQRMESIGTLAGGIAHNFNNLLMGIQGNVSLMLLETDCTHSHNKRLMNIENLVQKGAKLTAQLLGYAREGKYEVKPISLNQLVEETSDTFGMTKKEITIHQEPAQNLFGIKADQGQIEQVLLNLYINASDAMPGGGALFLKTMNVTDKDMTGKPYTPKIGDYVLLTVGDTGVGMGRKTMERIFDPFFTTKGLSSGTGLGLASVYGIIKSHGGYIDVCSEKGQGTSFNIYLPAAENQIIEKELRAENVLKGTETILLVDDEEIVLDVGVHLLKALGYTVLKARSGKEAVEIYKSYKDRISMVILDMIMPGMGGGKTFDLMKEMDPDIAVLLSSGYSLDEEAARILKRGCDGFIQKPFDIVALSLKIREILDEK